MCGIDIGIRQKMSKLINININVRDIDISIHSFDYSLNSICLMLNRNTFPKKNRTDRLCI